MISSISEFFEGFRGRVRAGVFILLTQLEVSLNKQKSNNHLLIIIGFYCMKSTRLSLIFVTEITSSNSYPFLKPLFPFASYSYAFFVEYLNRQRLVFV